MADEAKDQPAADSHHGPSRDDMASVYRETISDERLKAVADHVRSWLFTIPARGNKKAAADPAAERK